MKFLDFPDVIPDEAQQGPIPRQSLVYATTGARRHPCASQPDHKFTVALLLRLGSAGSCHFITGSFIAMRMVSLRFHQQEIKRGGGGEVVVCCF